MKLINIRKIYNQGKENEFKALDNINLDLNKKGLIFLEGQSGSGKTTLLNIISGLDKPTSGKIENEYGKNYCSMIFQDFQLIDSLTIEENLDLIKEIMPTSLDKKEELVKKYGLEKILNHYPNQISGGEKQRVAIVRAILQNRPMIVCDEPTGNLDEENSIKIAELLFEESKNRLVIVASHDTELFINKCNRHIHLKKGEIIKDEIINDIDNEEINVIKNSEVNLKLKTQTFLSLKLSKKFKKKNFTLLFTVFLTLILLLTSLNGLLNTEGTVIYNVYKEINEPYIDFFYKSYMGPSTLIESDYQLIGEDNIEYKIVDDLRQNFNNYYKENEYETVVTLSRLYLANKCDKNILCGTNDLKKGGMLISDYLARQVMDYFKYENIEQVLDMELFYSQKVIGVYQTSYSSVDKSKSNKYLTKVYQTAYMSEQVYIDYIFSNTQKGSEVSTIINENFKQYINIYNQTCLGEITTIKTITYGMQESLNEGEIAISENLANLYTDDYQSLIDKKIKLTYTNYRIDYHNQYNKLEKEYTVKYIYRDIYTSMVLTSQEYKNINDNYYTNYYNSTTFGVGIKSSNKKLINKLVKNNLVVSSYISDDIYDGTDWLKTLNFLELGVGIILLIITMIVICNHISTILDKEKRVLGVLVSLGIPVKKTVLTYLLNIIIYILAGLLITYLAEFIILEVINGIILKMRITTVKLLLYQFSAVIIIFLFLVILIGYFYMYTASKLKKKEIIDIIYER